MHYSPQLITTRWHRLRASLFPILQVGVAAGLANWIAQHLFSHHQPFFAPMAAVIVLGLTGGDRLRRAVELNIGVSLGVGIGDLFVGHFGTGWWQMPLLVMVSLALAVFVDKGPLMATQAAIGSVLIATIMPPGTSGGSGRMLDAFVGGLVGVMVIALLPTSPLKGGRQEISKVLFLASATLEKVASGVRESDPDSIQAALQRARGSQANINAMIAAAKEGKESLKVSPLLWRQKHQVNSLVRVLNPVDNVMRNTRVMARRSVVLAQDHDTVSEEQIHIIQQLAAVTDRLAHMYAGSGAKDASAETAELTKVLRKLAAQSGLEIAQDRVLSAQVILGQTRSIIVDLLQICGMSRRSAQATLRPTSEHPALPPEVVEE
ncbi:membrane protein [Corynebacterium aquilae DSM 44791]|uniref:Membrane protein n=1 Tax=Corynebacterium aquilae DSM 44791 TaxID=1431546 RepID=A0A1L7CI58_9CORY|nr:membrane protein [Corynebacterium aquilae DSM 44791]